MKITKIEIENYKSIKHTVLELKDINILLGANGAGKSNFISFLKLLNNIILKRLQAFAIEEGEVNNLFHRGIKNSEYIYSRIDFGDNAYSFKLKPTQDHRLFFESEDIFWKASGTRNIGLMNFETNLYENSGWSGVRGYIKDGMKSWKVYHFHDTSKTAKVKDVWDIEDNQTLNPDASNLASFLYFLEEEYSKNFKKIVKTIQLVAPYFEAFDLNPRGKDKDKIRLEWKEFGNDNSFSAHNLSDGTIRFICLATLLLQPDVPDTIIIDEPELGLHPYAINVLASLMQAAAANGSQLIISTQSVTLVNQFSFNDVIVVDKKDSASVFTQLDEDVLEEWLDEYALGELWEKNLLGGRPQ